MNFIANEIAKKLIIENLIKNGKIELSEAEVITKIANQVVDSVFSEVVENMQIQAQSQDLQENSTSITKKLNKII